MYIQVAVKVDWDENKNHTIRELSGGDELYWIISARYATSAERKAYEEGIC